MSKPPSMLDGPFGLGAAKPTANAESMAIPDNPVINHPPRGPAPADEMIELLKSIDRRLANIEAKIS